MKIDDQLINKLEKLSKLTMSNTQKAEAKKALEEIVRFTQNLNTLDVSKIDDVVYNPIKGATPLREDVVNSTDENISKDILDNAIKTEEGFFVVPKVIE